ncbi:hypothetical protein [Nocardia vulneris]|uniref:Uncharacterized protein n=1 Tax=Nocardia vulneris TaxID=1141657 RepID=A0ABR4ZCH1_9NOCA|nr:hypothetical protein [Nocardia vulneris]KIA63015.1 hypothetical protein FG87_21870 [Nocardia vulneris]
MSRFGAVIQRYIEAGVPILQMLIKSGAERIRTWRFRIEALAELLEGHYPYDMLDVDTGREWRECACGYRFDDEPKQWAQHVATVLAADGRSRGTA